MPYYYQIFAKHKSGEEISDILTTADSKKGAEEYGRHRLAGGPYDDGSLPEFKEARRISKAQARRMWSANPIDHIHHDEMRNALED